MKRIRPSSLRVSPLTSHSTSASRQAHLSRSFVSITASHSQPVRTQSSSNTPSPLLLRPTSTPTSHSLTAKSPPRRHASSSSEADLKKTPLYDLHVSHSAKLVPYGGHHMPLLYGTTSHTTSHLFTRSSASLFDVSHMVQQFFRGPGATAFLQRVTPADLVNLPVHHSTLSALLWEGTGGIVDDTVITRLGPEEFYVVTNAECRDKDGKYFSEELERFRNESVSKGTEGLKREVEWEVLDGWGLIALQGPKAASILESVLADPESANLKELYFGQSKYLTLKIVDNENSGAERTSSPLHVARGGYTGEDGFEISIPPSEALAVATTLLETAGPETLQLAGLGARDSLRLEAGMCLYGHDLNDTTTPVEASLSWIVGKPRRTAADFHGANVIIPQLTPKSKGGAGVSRRRVGIVIEKGAPAREGAEIIDLASGEKKEVIGTVTSGCPSPSLGQNIAMGYVRDGFHKVGTEVGVLVRGKERKGLVTKMPFVESGFWRAPPAAPEKKKPEALV